MPLACGPYLGWKGRPYPAQEIVIIIFLLFTTKRKLQLAEFMACMESQKQRRQNKDLNLGLWAPRHEFMTSEPRCLHLSPFRFCCILAISYGVPARL